MCLNCGCGQPEERHGDPANITLADVERAAQANGQTLEEATRHITDTLATASLDRAGELSSPE